MMTLKFLKFFNFVFLFSIFLVISYLIYKSEFYYLGNKRIYYLKYIIFFIFIFIIFVYLLYRDHKKIVNYYLVIFSTIITLYICESFLTILKIFFLKQEVNQPSRNIVINQKLSELKISLEDRSIVKNFFFYFKEKFENPSVYSILFPSQNSVKNVNLFPFSGLKFSNVLHCNENGYFSNYFTDRFGFNNPDDKIWDKEINIVLVGDSMGNGACVKYEDSIASHLSKKKNLLNLSYDGNGPLINYSVFKEYILNDKIPISTLVFLYFEGNDLPNLNEELSSQILKNYLFDDNFTQNLKKKADLIEKINRDILNQFIENKMYYLDKVKKESEISLIKENFMIINKNNFKLNFLDFVKLSNLRENCVEVFFPPDPPNWQHFVKIINKINDYAQKDNFEFVFVYLPSWEYFTYHGDYHYKKVKNYIKNKKIKLVDMREIFGNYEDPLNFFSDRVNYHYTAVGYKIISDEILKILSIK